MVVDASAVLAGDEEYVEEEKEPPDVRDRGHKSGNSLPNENKSDPVRNLAVVVIDDTDANDLFTDRLATLNEQVNLVPSHAENPSYQKETTESRLGVAIPGAYADDGSR